MDRNREARRASIVGSNGFNRRRHRTNNLRDSPDEDGGLELQESGRLRDRVRKDRDRERERDRERGRDRERERERERDLRERSSRSKRRRGERLASNREDIGADETSEESVNEDEDDEDEENASAAGVRLLTPAVGSISNLHGHLGNHHHNHSSSFSSQQQHNSNSSSNIVSNNHHLQHRKTYPPSSSFAKILRAPPVWKSGDEMMGVSVPRKARSACTKRSHDWISSHSNNNSCGGVSGGEQGSPARQGGVSTATPPPAAPMSPSSSNVSIRKKLKSSVNNSGPKLKPPKVSSKPSSSNPEELEIEIAEVLYGLMTQSQGLSSKKEDSREINGLNGDAKSRHSSPISNSTSTNNPISGTNSGPISAVAPKRKRLRQMPENSSYGAKPDTDQTPKSEISSPNVEKILVLQAQPAEPPAPAAPDSTKSDSELKPVAEELWESKDLVAKDEVSSQKEKESPAVRAEDSSNGDSPSTATAPLTTKSNSTAAEMENQKEEKLVIDLMAPPPQVRSSPDRETKMDLRDAVMDQKPVASIVDANLKPDDENSKSGSGKDHLSNAAAEEKKGKGSGEEAESQKTIENKGRNVDLHLDLEKSEKDGGEVNATGNKSQSQTQKQQRQQIPLKATREVPLSEKSGHSISSLPLPMSMASWPGGLPPMGYMAPLQGVVSMDGRAITPGHIQSSSSQPRPKRCATHCHIARNIHALHQFMKMNPFWPPPAGSASLFGSKPCNVNVMPAADMHGNINIRGVNNAQDKGQSTTSIPNHNGKDKGSQPATSSDAAQRKQQILIQQALPPLAPSNLLGPAFIFPLNQQQSAVAARPNGAKSPATGASSGNSSAAVTSSSSAAAGAAAAAMSFNYPNMPSNETQYLAILQNNGYPFPIPAVGPSPNYRGAPAQAMPFFNGSFYPSQMIHPSHLQHPQPPQLLQAHQNASASSGNSSSQKHLQSQQQKTQNGGVSGGSVSVSLQESSSQKTQPSQQLQQSHNQYAHASQPRHLEGEPGSKDRPSTTDSRVSMNIYGQNFPLPIFPQNFALMTPPAGLANASNNQIDKKTHQTLQPGLKSGVESLPPHGFAMSFGTINGTNTGPGIDLTSMAQNYAIFQSSSEAAARQNIQMLAAAQAAQKNFRSSEDGKSGGVDSSGTGEERKSSAGKAPGSGGQTIAFTRQDLADEPVTSIQANSVVESSARSSRSMTTNAVGAIDVPNAQNIQAQFQQHQMLQQLKQQQQLAANAVSRSKVPVTSNGSIYTDHLNSSSAKIPNALSGFPQNLVQSNSSSPTQSPQWKSSTKTPIPHNPSSLSSSTMTTLKNLPQQQSRTQPQMHTQISFGGNQKQSATSQGQVPPGGNQTPSSPMMVGSPTTSSVSKGASGSPRTTSSASTNNKMSQASSLLAQPPKNSPSVHSRKSPSILGNPHIASSSSSTGSKSQMQQQSQQQLPKTMQQAQLIFSHPYTQAQSPHSASTSSTTSGLSGYYMPRRRPDHQHQQAPVTSSGGLSLCSPITMGMTNTNDPAKAIAAATANVKGGGLPSHGIIHAPPFAAQSAGTLLPAGFSFVHPVPAAVQVKPAEQKQPAA